MELYQGALLSDDNLKAYYRMNAGALVDDSSPNGKTLTNQGSVAENVAGKFGGAADLGNPNSSKFFEIADDFGLSRHAQSISIWIKLNAEIASGEWVFVGINSAANDDGIEIGYQYNAGTRKLHIGYARNGIGFAGEINYNVALGTSAWHHIVLTWTGDNTANGIKAYLNNSLIGQVTATVGAGSSAGNNVRIGARANGAYGYSSCLVDDVSFFDKVLNTTEIGLLFNRIVKTLDGLATASGKTINGLAIASVKSINGLY